MSVQACGGRSDTEDYLLYGYDAPVAGAAASGGSPGSGASSSTGGKKPGKGGTTGTGASAPVGGDVNAGGSVAIAGTGAGAQGGVGATAGFGQGGFAQAGTGFGGTGGFVPVTCGGDVCNLLTESCCATLGGIGCIPLDQECPGANLLCGSTSDCTDDQVCCLRLIGEANATAQCKDACDGMGPQRERRLCTDDSECSQNRPFCRDTTFGVRVCTRF